MERPTDAIKKLHECVSCDTCENERCEYFLNLSNIKEVLEYIKFLEDEIEVPRRSGNAP